MHLASLEECRAAAAGITQRPLFGFELVGDNRPLLDPFAAIKRLRSTDVVHRS